MNTRVNSMAAPRHTGPADGAVETLRRIKLFKRAGLLGGKPFEGSIARAASQYELTEAYRLVHDVFVEEGYILPDPAGIRVRAFEAFPAMATFVGEVDDEVVGVMGITPDSSDIGLPSDKAFHPELDALRSQGLLVSEVTNLALKPEHRRSSLFFDLTRACFAQTRQWDCDAVFISVCPRHAGFFRDVLHFASCGDARSYSKDITDIVQGMTMNLRTVGQQFIETDQLLGEDALLHDSFFANNPFYEKCLAWSPIATEAFRDPGFLEELFVSSCSLLHRCTWKELGAIRRWWGAELFDEVFERQRRCFDAARVGVQANMQVSFI